MPRASRSNRSAFPVLATLAVVALVVMPGIRAASAAEIVVKMATLAPQGSTWHTVLQEMAADWQKLSKGQVAVRLYPGGVAGDDTDVIRKMRLDTLNAGVVTSTGLTEVDRSVLAMEIPMAFASYPEFDCVLAKMEPELEQALDAKGFVLLAWADVGYVHFFTKSPVRTPEDLRQLKLFAWAGDDQYVELWKSAGFNPVPLPSSEISTALQTGLVQAVPATPQMAAVLQWYNQAKNMTDLNWAVLMGGFVISKATWEKIPADIRPALKESARAAGRKLSVSSRESAPSDVDAMQKHGLNVVKLDAATLAGWEKLMFGVYPKVRGTYLPAATMDNALRYRDECRAGAGGK